MCNIVNVRYLIQVLCVTVFGFRGATCMVREFYIAAVEVEWDYAPSGRNLFNGDQRAADVYIKNDHDRIGSKYTKACYKLFTDASYTYEVATEPWLGIVGPILRAEVGDIMVIHFRNFASKGNFSVHPHGVQYLKNSEGSLYLDGTSGADKLDDMIPPGGAARYIWNITDNFAPTADDENCLPWAYHSHVVSPRDVDTGLIGMLLTCKPGILDNNGHRQDMDKEFVVYMDINDEGQSWYIEDNIQRCGNSAECRHLHATEDTDFRDSNRMFAINGFVFGHLPGFEACEGERVVWHMMSLNLGAHTANIMGQTMTVKKHRKDTVFLNPATFVSGHMTPVNPGRWLLHCRNQDHVVEGMTAFFTINRCPGFTMPITHTGTKRRYFIAAEEVRWNYAPSGKDFFGGTDLMQNHHARHYFEKGPQRIGGTYLKAVYREYTDETFSSRKKRGGDEAHLGLLGPVIKVEVGDTVEVTMLNRARRPYSFLAKGVAFDKTNEGARYMDANGNLQGAILQPGQVGTYHFSVPGIFAPTDHDPNCITYMYHSAVDLQKDIYSGLLGPLIVCKPGSLLNGRQRYADKEFFVWYSVIDENESWYIDDNIHILSMAASVDKENEEFKESNMMHAINGLTFANLDGLHMCKGEIISWHFFATGAREDMHTYSFHGNNFIRNGQHRDTHVVFPGTSSTVYMKPDNIGRWALLCHVLHHAMTGMTALYDVKDCSGGTNANHPPKSFLSSGKVRRYYIAAVEIYWDYAPVKRNVVSGADLRNPDTTGHKFIRNDDYYIGSVFKKAVYREYTDETFTVPKPRSAEEAHLGLMGPPIKAEVGDTIEVIFFNNASIPYSIAPHGVLYDKANEGAQYNDGSPHVRDNAVPPGRRYLYRWFVPERSGPGPTDPNCMGWLYHSGTNAHKDGFAGLMGPLITCRRGILDNKGHRMDGVDREFAVLFFEIDENQSWYFNDNLKQFAPRRNNTSDPDFEESNMKSSINGYIFGNVPGLIMNEGDRVVWYILGLGSEWTDLHTAHFHGQTFLFHVDKVHRGDVMEVFPGTYETVEMITDNPGTWILHCHVSVHMMDGMEALYTIRSSRQSIGMAMSLSHIQDQGVKVAPIPRHQTSLLMPFSKRKMQKLILSRTPSLPHDVHLAPGINIPPVVNTRLSTRHRRPVLKLQHGPKKRLVSRGRHIMRLPGKRPIFVPPLRSFLVPRFMNGYGFYEPPSYVHNNMFRPRKFMFDPNCQN